MLLSSRREPDDAGPAIALVRFTRLARAFTHSPAWTALAWYLGFALLNLPFEMPFELKDFTLGLVVLGGLAARDTLAASAVTGA